jgi:hypothetical protein
MNGKPREPLSVADHLDALDRAVGEFGQAAFDGGEAQRIVQRINRDVANDPSRTSDQKANVKAATDGFKATVVSALDAQRRDRADEEYTVKIKGHLEHIANDLRDELNVPR